MPTAADRRISTGEIHSRAASEVAGHTVRFVHLDCTRLGRSRVLEDVLLRRVPEDGIVDGRYGEVLSDSPVLLTG